MTRATLGQEAGGRGVGGGLTRPGQFGVTPCLGSPLLGKPKKKIAPGTGGNVLSEIIRAWQVMVPEPILPSMTEAVPAIDPEEEAELGEESSQAKGSRCRGPGMIRGGAGAKVGRKGCGGTGKTPKGPFGPGVHGLGSSEDTQRSGPSSKASRTC